MDKVFEEIADLNKLIHEPARLAILTALAACKQADFVYLQRLTGLTKGNLSSHLNKLEAAKMVLVEKAFDGKKPITYLSLTKTGNAAIEQHWSRLDSLRNGAEEWTSQSQKGKE